jgi:WD40 repeat protein
MTPQQSIAHYRITGKLGEGGMGEVWRAVDTKLNREVAIKVLPDSFAGDPDRLARFQREAQVLASLNHANIAAIYGVEDRALILELVEGPTLADRMAQGAIPFEEALPLIGQLIDALETAHERGVVHRDLKPANIKVTPDGRIKVLDFGLAKALASDASPGDPSSSPTLTMNATLAGAIMGTAAYMAPEQARGHNVDKRADIWSFGVVVHEMLAGHPLFLGATISDTLAAVLTREPAWNAIPTRAQRLLRACLEKDPKRRLRDIGDARRLLEETAPAETSRARVLPWIAAVALLAAAAAVAGFVAWRATRAVEHPLARLSVDLGPDAVAGSRFTAILSPDGTRIVYPVRNPEGRVLLATRTLDQPKATPLPGTEGATDAFFSPDGQWLGFFSASKLKKVSVHGGSMVVLASTPASRGAAWSTDGYMLLVPALSTGLHRMPDTGGTMEQITFPSKDGDVTHRWPQFLPGGKIVLFTASPQAGDYDEASIKTLNLATGQVKTVQTGGYFGRYLPSGHLVYVHQGALFAVPFALDKLETRGVPAPVQDEVAGNPIAGAGQFDFSTAGTLVYLPGKGQSQGSLISIDTAGQSKTMLPASRLYLTPRFSPDGKRLALGIGSGDLWVYTLQTRALTQLTFNARVGRSPVWTRDGKHIVHSAFGSKGGFDIWWTRTDGAGDPQVLFQGNGSAVYPYSFSPDGKRLAFVGQSVTGGLDIWVLPLDITDPEHPKAGTPERFLDSPAAETEPAFSPDGRWIAYASDDTGSSELYVRPYRGATASGGMGRWRISNNGGRSPQWARDGKRLYYLGGDDRIAVADCAATDQSFACGTPRRWSDRQIADPIQGPLRMFDLAPDASGFVLVEFNPSGGSTQTSVHVTFLLNFFDELRRIMPLR